LSLQASVPDASAPYVGTEHLLQAETPLSARNAARKRLGLTTMRIIDDYPVTLE
jgi:hypothetical protein